MMGQKKLSEIRANLLEACAAAGIEPAVWFDEQIRKAKGKKTPKQGEIETLLLVRDGLLAKSRRKSSGQRKSVTR